MKSITITAFQRDALFSSMLRSVVANDLDGWQIFVAIEHGPKQEEMAQIAAKYLPAGQTTILRNPTRLGVRENPKAAITAAFSAGSEFNLFAKELNVAGFQFFSESVKTSNFQPDMGKALIVLFHMCGYVLTNRVLILKQFDQSVP